MAGGFSIGVAADTRAFESGVKAGIIEPVEDAQDKLEQLGRSGDKAGDGLSKGAREGELSLGKLGQAGKEAGDDVERGTRDADRALGKLGQAGKEAGDDLESGLKGAQKQTELTAADYRAMSAKIKAETEKIKASSRESFEGAGGASGEFKDEALANFSEVTSSFQGDMTSITDLAQGTFGGLASIGGPASLVFGGIAVAVGLVGQALASSGEESDEFKEKIADLAQTRLGDLFGQYEDSGDDLARGLRKWATDADSFGGSLVDLQKNTKRAKLDAGDYASAIATQSVPKMKQLRTEVEAHIKSLDRQAAAQRGAGSGASALAADIGKESDAAREVKKQLDSNLEVNDAYEKSLRAVARAQGMTVDQYKASLDATAAYEAATKTLAETISGALTDAAQTSADVLDNTAANPQMYIEGMAARVQAVKDYQANVQQVGQELPDDLFNWVREQGPGFSEEVATYVAATPEQKTAIRESWAIEAQVTADTSDVDKKTTDQAKKKTKGPTSQVQGDTSDLDGKVDKKSKEKPAGPTSQVRADTAKVDEALKKLKGQTVDGPTVKYRVDMSAVDRANRSITNSPLTQIVNQQIGKRVA